MGEPPFRDSSNWSLANGRGEAARLWWLPEPRDELKFRAWELFGKQKEYLEKSGI